MINYIVTLAQITIFAKHPCALALLIIIVFLILLILYILSMHKKKIEKLSEDKIIQLKEKTDILQASEEKYRRIFESAAEGILIADIETMKFTSANPAICKMLGYSEKEILAMSVPDIHPEESLEYVIEKFKEQARREIVLAPNIPCLTKDNNILLTNVCTSNVLFHNKVHNIGFFSDISKTRQLTEIHNQLTAAIEQTHEVIVITDLEGNIEYVNPAFERVSGYTREEALGKNPSINKGKGQSDSYYKQMWETISAGNVWTGKFYNKKKDGTEYEEEATISPVRNSDGKIVNYVAVKRDITHEEQMQTQLRQAQKMEAVGLLAGGLAHDFNNILQTISGYVNMILNDKSLAESHRNDLTEVKHASDRAADLTARILSFSRQQAINPVNLNIHSMVDNATKMLRRIIGENITLEISHGNRSDGTGVAQADPSQMEQALMNLCINARDAMPGGGTINIKVDSITPDATHKPNLLLGKDSRCVLLEVSDTGTGISKAIQEKIFDPFFTTKEPGKGTGLGLTSAYGIVKQHNGDIQVHSTETEGTTFRIYLPEIAKEVPIASKKNIIEDIAGGTETIFIAEDNVDVRNFVKRVLTTAGYSIITAVDGEDALRVFDENPDVINLALLDIIMPKRSGYEVRKHMQQKNSHVKFLFTSGYTNGTIPSELQSNDEYELLSKPYSPQELLQRIRDILDT